jgi:hypothetical protein
VASTALHGLSSQREAAGAAGKIKRAKNKFRAARAARQVEILLNESSAVNFFGVANAGRTLVGPLVESNFRIHLCAL